MNFKTTGLAAATVLAFGVATIAPASADQAAASRNLILGGIAAVAGIAIENNIAHKRAAANTVAGTLPDGATVYNDGRVVNPDGTTYYPNQSGQQVSCNNGYCTEYGQNGYNNGGYYNNNGNWNTGYGRGNYSSRRR